MQDGGDQYEYTNVYPDYLLIFIKITTIIMSVLNTLFPLKVVGESEFYLGGDMVTLEINGEISHTLSARTYIKNVSKKIENILIPHSRAFDNHLRGSIIQKLTPLIYL